MAEPDISEQVLPSATPPSPSVNPDSSSKLELKPQDGERSSGSAEEASTQAANGFEENGMLYVSLLTSETSNVTSRACFRAGNGRSPRFK